MINAPPSDRRRRRPSSREFGLVGAKRGREAGRGGRFVPVENQKIVGGRGGEVQRRVVRPPATGSRTEGSTGKEREIISVSL